MKKAQLLNQVPVLTAYFLVFLFTYTGVNKLIDHATFETTLFQSPLLRHHATLISWLIPLVELLFVSLLLSNKFRQTGMLLSLAMMVIFTGYIAYMILFIPGLPCSCGGILKELSWPGHLLFNSGIIVLILASLYSYTRNKFLLQ
jgi:hypothetical protein